MKQSNLLVPSVWLLAGAAFALSACSGSEGNGGGGSTGGGGGTSTSSGNGAPTDSGLPGLILGLSTTSDSGPEPSTMVLLRPESAAADAAWTEERIVAKKAEIEVAIGTFADGTPAAGELGADGKPKNTLRYAPANDGWSFEPAEGEVTWETIEKDDGSVQHVTKSYEMEGGNVFHKGMWFEPAFGEPGILTISANMPYLCIWHRKGNTWQPTVLWSQVVGGKEQRFRDIEVGDVDGDGQDELVVVTHDYGAIYVVEQTENGMVPTEIHRWEERTFAHEAEIGDVDGDGKPEFFTTPSAPNKADSSFQPGSVDMYRHNADTGEYERTTVVAWPRRHAKEVMVGDYDGDGVHELYCAVEAKGAEDKVNEIHRYVWQDGEMVLETIIEGLDGTQCRFLVMADTDGDGTKEIIASTYKSGIYRSVMDEEGNWTTKKIVPSYMSGGFEHATYAMDMDGDGKDELYVASDEQKSFNVFRLNETTGGFRPSKLANWSEESFYLVWNIMTLPAGK